ncbi:MAG: hypothetical protein ACKOWG_10990, partial [Planctomycetia bacterium]
VVPAFEFRNLRAYDEGISDFVTMQYDLPGTSTRVLAIFGDHRGRGGGAARGEAVGSLASGREGGVARGA